MLIPFSQEVSLVVIFRATHFFSHLDLIDFTGHLPFMHRRISVVIVELDGFLRVQIHQILNLVNLLPQLICSRRRRIQKDFIGSLARRPNVIGIHITSSIRRQGRTVQLVLAILILQVVLILQGRDAILDLR